jgi:hypothetical protein
VHLVGFIIKKYVWMHGHMNVLSRCTVTGTYCHDARSQELKKCSSCFNSPSVRRLSEQNDATNSYETGKQQLVIVKLCVIIYTYNYIIAGVCENYHILVRSLLHNVSQFGGKIK